MAKQHTSVHHPVYGQISPLQNQLLRSASNPQGVRDALAELSQLGALDENLLATTLQRSGSRRGQQEILDAINEGRQRRYGGGSYGRSSGTPRYNPLTGGNSRIEFTDHGSGETFIEEGMNPADQAELARRQAMEEQAIMEQGVRTLGTVAARTGPDAQAARQILGVPLTPGYDELISPEQDRVNRTRIAQESTQRAQIEKFARQPGATQAQIDELWQQHQQQYPEFDGGQRPLTRAEQLEQMRMQKLQTYQQAIPDVPLDYDDKGQIAVLPGWAEAQTAKAKALELENERLKLDNRQRDDEYRRQSDILKSAYPEGGSDFTRQQIDLYKRFYGPGAKPSQPPAPPAPPEQGSSLPVNRALFAQYQAQASAAGVALVVDQDDYDSLEPGERFIDVADGQTYEK